MPLSLQVPGSRFGNGMPNELRGLRQCAIVRIHLYLRDQRDYAAVVSDAPQCVLDRLLDHVANPSRGARYKHSQRKWRHLGASYLVANELVSNLRTVAMNDADVPAFVCEIDDGAKALACMAELVGNR